MHAPAAGSYIDSATVGITRSRWQVLVAKWREDATRVDGQLEERVRSKQNNRSTAEGLRNRSFGSEQPPEPPKVSEQPRDSFLDVPFFACLHCMEVQSDC